MKWRNFGILQCEFCSKICVYFIQSFAHLKLFDRKFARERHRDDHIARVCEALHADYPFDPCCLVRTAERVKPFYQEWFSSEKEEHFSAYEKCADAVDEYTLEEDEPNFEFAEEQLELAAQQLPPAINIPNLSERAARLLSHLGAGSFPSQNYSFWAFRQTNGDEDDAEIEEDESKAIAMSDDEAINRSPMVVSKGNNSDEAEETDDDEIASVDSW